jgi:DNA-binding PadR family transcriptional regulator
VFDLAILGLLSEQELHGYELKKRLAELFGGRASISFGSLYPALARLEKQGAVKAVEERTEVPAAPMSGSLVGELAAFRARVRAPVRARGGRGKKVYGITDNGRERLAELMTDPDVSDDRAFSLRVALCRHLDSSARLELFERRRAELMRRRDEAHRRRPASDGGAVSVLPDVYRRALLERDATAIDHDLAWIERLIEAERQALSQEDHT